MASRLIADSDVPLSVPLPRAPLDPLKETESEALAGVRPLRADRPAPQALSTLPATLGERRFAVATVAVSAAVFAALAPFAKLPLTPIPAFLPAYQSALIFSDLITVVLLLG